jgi:hypothetical protein
MTCPVNYYYKGGIFSPSSISFTPDNLLNLFKSDAKNGLTGYWYFYWVSRVLGLTFDFTGSNSH